MTDSTNTLNGLILDGGNSKRMGRDKSLLDYHGIPQIEYVFRLLEEVCHEVHISTSSNKRYEFTNQVIEDRYPIATPLNGIMSAFHYSSATAWLVIAVDLPFINELMIDRLIKARDRSKVATAYTSKDSERPEPLIAIWEPIAFTFLEEGAEQFNYSPTKFLMNNEVTLVEAFDNFEVFNANTREDFERAKKMIEFTWNL